jgi:hypothetical protein
MSSLDYRNTEFVRNQLAYFIEHYDFSFTESDVGSMGEWYVLLDSSELQIVVSHDRNEFTYLEIGSKVRPRPGAHLRSWSLGHIRGFLDGEDVHYQFHNLNEQIEWLKDHEDIVMKSSFINSDELNQWAVKAARIMFG